MEFIVNSAAGIGEIMPQLFESLGKRRKIALYGEMGAGKTTFTSVFCHSLGVREPTASPTFSLINEYRYTDADGQPALIHHLDLYRLHNLQEAFDIGIEDVLYDPWYCLIEWPQVAEALLPADAAKIRLDILGETRRRILIL